MPRVILDVGQIGGSGTNLTVDGSILSQLAFHIVGDLTITVANLVVGDELLVEIVNSGSTRNLTWSGVTIWNASAAPASIGSGKVLLVALKGLVNSDIAEMWRIAT